MQKFRKILGVCCVIAAIALLAGAARMYWEYKSGEAVYDALKTGFTKRPGDGDDNNERDDSESSPDTPIIKEDAGTDDFVVDWESLLAQNKDVVGWIQTESGADYPILKGVDNAEYLYADINHDYNINGSVFLCYLNSADWSDKNSIVYGHNMNSGAMFGGNKQYKDEDFAREHPYFYIYTPVGKYTYRIFGVVVTQDQSECYNPSVKNDTEMAEYISVLKRNAMYWLADPQPADHVVTLSTCTGQAHGTTRLLIHGYMDSFTPIGGGKTVDRAELQRRIGAARQNTSQSASPSQPAQETAQPTESYPVTQ